MQCEADMAFNFSPKIVTDGLVLYLDAAHKKSYAGSGAVWTDLSRNNSTGTLINGPTFNTANGGSIVFDRVDDYVSIPYNANIFGLGTGDFTFECWYYQTATTDYQRLFSNGAYNTGGIFQVETPGVGSSGNTATVVVHVNTFYATYTTTSSVNVWRNVIVTRNAGNVTVYVNGTSIGTQTQNESITNTTDPTIGSNSTAGDRYGGRIAIVRLYKGKFFTANEVLQNYSALKGRFGL